MNIKFNNWLCKVVRSRYENGRVCLRLQDVNTNAWVAKATVNLPHVELAEDEVIIKNYSENEGILEILVKAGIVLPPHRMVQTGFAEASVCTLLVDMDDMPVAFSVRH